MKWKEAATFCANNNGVLESNLTEIQTHSAGISDLVWTGQYYARTDWFVIWGCFNVRQAKQFAVNNGDIHGCHKVCTNRNSDYFSLYMKNQCLCLNENDLLSKVKEYLPCNCCNCFQVKKIITVTGKVDSRDKTTKCCAAQCVDYKIKLTIEDCDKRYKVVCDRTIALQLEYLGQIEGAQACQDHASFLKWYTDDICRAETDKYKQQHWTSGTSTFFLFNITPTDNATDLKPTECISIDKSSEKNYSCGEKMPFICRYNTNSSGTLFLPDCHEPPIYSAEEESNIAGVIVGTVLSLAVVIILVSASRFIYRQRQRNFNKPVTKAISRMNIISEPCDEMHHTRLSSPYSEIDDAQLCTNQKQIGVFTLAVRKRDNISSGNFDVVTNGQNVIYNHTATDFGQCEYKIDSVKSTFTSNNLTTNEDTVSPPSDYCLAKPLEVDTGHSVTNKDYDHLNNVTTKKDNVTCKVYDHITIHTNSDPTYDHAVINSPGQVNDNYDHFRLNHAENLA